MADSAIRTRLLESRTEARESQLQLAATQYGYGTWTYEPGTGEIHCSARALSLLGLPADAQPVFDTLLSLIHADDRERVGNTFAHALTVRDQFALEFTLAGDSTGGTQLRCLGRAHTSALNPDRHALSGVLCPVAEDAGGLITLDSQRLGAMVLRLEGMGELERNTLLMRLQSGMVPKLQDLRQHMLMLASDSTLTAAQRARLAAVLDLTHTCLDALREAAFELQPPGVPELGFCGALERYARDTAAAAGLQLSLSLPADPLPLSAAATAALYQAARAGIDNVVAHAHAQRMSVRVDCDRSDVVLRISDDGDGIRSTDLARMGALGLFSASARLGACAGCLRIRARPEGGTLLKVSIAMDHTSAFRHSGEAPGRAA